MKTKLKLKYVENAIIDMVAAFRLPPNQSILNFGKRYDSFSSKKNDEIRWQNVKDAIRYLLNLYNQPAFGGDLVFSSPFRKNYEYNPQNFVEKEMLKIEKEILRIQKYLNELYEERYRQHKALRHLAAKIDSK